MARTAVRLRLRPSGAPLWVVALVGLSACDGRAGWERETLGRAYFDSTGAYVHAGVSTRADPDIDPLRASSLGADTTVRSYHLYAMRCGSCHDAPDPVMKTAEHWSFLVGRMQEKTRTAGLIPMTDAEADSILAFLRRHAGDASGTDRRRVPKRP